MAVLTRRQKLTATTTTLPILPFELIIEILCNLPVKFLMKLKCVCKSWNSLFSEQEFTRKHLRNSTMNPNLILKSIRKYSPEFSDMVYPIHSLLTDVTIKGTHINFPLNTDNYYTYIVGSCDGLLILTQGDYGDYGVSFQTVLWNPSIRKYNILPSPNFPQEARGIPKYGFGYDQFTCNYKVVAILRYKCLDSNVYKTQVKIHTLGTDDSWRLIEDFPSVSSSASYLSSGKFVSGTINWLVRCSVALWAIVSLDLGTESCQEILQPDYGEEEVVMVKSCSLGVLRDCLCILRGHRTNSSSSSSSDIWLMKEYGNRESWIRLFNISNSTNFTINRVLYIFEHDQVLLDIWPMLNHSFAVYESINGTMKIRHVDKFGDLRQPEIYVESLIWPCS